MAAPDVAIYHAPPRALAQFADIGLRHGARKHVALTTWETSEMPVMWRDPILQNFDAVIMPSEFCIDSLGGCGPEYLQYVIPHCFDEGFWPRPPTRPRAPRDPIRFYTIGAWGERKNSMGVLKAYLSAFSKSDRTELMMLISGADFDEIRSVVARSGIPADQLPAITIPDEVTLSERDLVDLHAAGNCFVSATRGEGWGLGLFEAAIMGRQVISPMWGGQRDFLQGYPEAIEIRHVLTPCFGSETKVDVAQVNGKAVRRSTVVIPPGVDCRQLWAEPSLEDLAMVMRSMYQHRTSITPEDAQRYRTSLEQWYGYKVIGPQFLNTLKEISES